MHPFLPSVSTRREVRWTVGGGRTSRVKSEEDGRGYVKMTVKLLSPTRTGVRTSYPSALNG